MGLKIPRQRCRKGSTPFPGTIEETGTYGHFHYFFRAPRMARVPRERLNP